MILVVIVAIVAFASSSVGFMLGRCWPSMRHSKPAAKGRKDGEDMLIFHEKVQRKGIRTRNIMPACVLITKHGEKYHTSAECKGLRGATSKPKEFDACKVCAKRIWHDLSDASD